MTPALPPSSRNRQRMLRRVQIIISLTLLVGLIWYIDWTTVWHTLRTASIGIIGLGVVVYYGGVLLSTIKWQLILHIEQMHVPLQRLIRWYLIGAFANNFLPSDIGGDIGRGIYAARYTGRPLAITRSIIVERFTGLLMMLVFAGLGVGVLLQQWYLMVGLVGGGGVMILFGRWLSAWFRRTRWFAATTAVRLEQARTVLTLYRNHTARVTLILTLSLVFQALAGVGVWINLLAVHTNVPLIPTILAAALTNVVGILPISINGWGVRESLLIGLLSPYAPASGVLAGALLARILVLCASLIGALALMGEQQQSGSSTAPPNDTSPNNPVV